MPTIISHTAIPLALRFGLGKLQISQRLFYLGLICCILPDADVLAFKFGIAYSHMFGHRGFSHSIFFAVLCGLAGMAAHQRLNSSRISAFVFLFICTLSHVLLDAMTNGGLGVAFFSPFSNERYFLPWQVIQVSPIGIDSFIQGRAWHVLLSEWYWVWLPSLALMTLLWIRQRVRRTK